MNEEIVFGIGGMGFVLVILTLINHHNSCSCNHSGIKNPAGQRNKQGGNRKG
jgi:hypothetical protein